MKTFKTTLTILALILGLTWNASAAATCLDFQDTVGIFTIAPSQTNYGATWYTNSGVTLRAKYFDYSSFGSPGMMNIADHVATGYTGSNGSSNYVGNIYYQGNAITEIDFSSLSPVSKKVEFDVNYILNNTSANPFMVNGQPLNALPAGITYTATPLTFGFHIEITGSINTIELHGFEAAIDNICIDSTTSTPPSASNCIDLTNAGMTGVVNDYNSDSTTPIGSAYISNGDLHVIKTLSSTGPGFEQSYINWINASEMLFHGYLTFDVSSASYSCKALLVDAVAPSKIIVDGDTIDITPGWNPYAGTGFNIDTVVGGAFNITGSFNSATFYAQTAMYHSVCLDSCASANTSACIDFQDTMGVYTIAPSQTNFGAPWYTNNGIAFSAKYFDYTLFNSPGMMNIADHVAAGYTGANGSSNYVGNIYAQADIITQIDFSALIPVTKKVEFDVNYILNNTSANPFMVNGQPLSTLPAGITYTARPLTFGFHIELTGNINTIELHGHEVGIDNLCVDSFTQGPPPPSSACFDFQDTMNVTTIAPSQTAYGATWYTNSGVNFKHKYFDYTSFNSPGMATIADHVASGYTGANGNSNFVGNIYYQGNVITEIDFSALMPVAKRVEFDINYILNNTSANPFRVNGQPLNALPAGITYTATPLTFGFHIEITGNVNTIELHGYEVAIDNICIDSSVVPPCTVTAMYTVTVNQMVVNFTNASSVNANTATQFIWNFGDGNTSGDNDPVHTYSTPGSYWVCLTVVDMNCPTNPTAVYCDSVTVGSCQIGHRIMTPNNDGNDDDVFLPKGSKVYDRNGFIVKQTAEDDNWNGTNDSNQPLPMGYYTITCGGGEVFNVTIVR